jgi:hypothetical protein
VAPTTCIGQHADRASAICCESRVRVVVVDIAASSSGALSVLKDFTDFLALQDAGVDWVCLVSSDAISSSVPWLRVVRDVCAKTNWLHRSSWEILIAPRLVHRYAPDAVFSLQNTAVAFTKVPQVVYVHQPLLFARWHRWSFVRSEEREMAVRARRACCTTLSTLYWRRRTIAKTADE